MLKCDPQNFKRVILKRDHSKSYECPILLTSFLTNAIFLHTSLVMLSFIFYKHANPEKWATRTKKLQFNAFFKLIVCRHQWAVTFNTWDQGKLMCSMAKLSPKWTQNIDTRIFSSSLHYHIIWKSVSAIRQGAGIKECGLPLWNALLWGVSGVDRVIYRLAWPVKLRQCWILTRIIYHSVVYLWFCIHFVLNSVIKQFWTYRKKTLRSWMFSLCQHLYV